MKKTNFDFESHSKINLGLKVLNQRIDGYHNINSIFIELDFNDTLSFKPSKDFQLICNNKLIPIDNTNTIYKVYHILNDKFHFQNHYKIILNKKNTYRLRAWWGEQ